MSKKYRIVFTDEGEGWCNCDYCGEYGHFSTNNFSEYGLFGFIDFSRSDLDNLGLYHLNQDSIRCEKCLMIKEFNVECYYTMRK